MRSLFPNGKTCTEGSCSGALVHLDEWGAGKFLAVLPCAESCPWRLGWADQQGNRGAICWPCCGTQWPRVPVEGSRPKKPFSLLLNTLLCDSVAGAAVPGRGAEPRCPAAEVSGGAAPTQGAAAGRTRDRRAGARAQHPHLPAQPGGPAREEEEGQVPEKPAEAQRRTSDQFAFRWELLLCVVKIWGMSNTTDVRITESEHSRILTQSMK